MAVICLKFSLEDKMAAEILERIALFASAEKSLEPLATISRATSVEAVSLERKKVVPELEDKTVGCFRAAEVIALDLFVIPFG